jgi:hypothetical protein
MPDLENRIDKVEESAKNIIVTMATLKTQVDDMHEILQERRRQADVIMVSIEHINKEISAINNKLFNYKSTALTILKTTIAMTTFFSAVGAAIWAIVTVIFNEVKE